MGQEEKGLEFSGRARDGVLVSQSFDEKTLSLLCPLLSAKEGKNPPYTSKA